MCPSRPEVLAAAGVALVRKYDPSVAVFAVRTMRGPAWRHDRSIRDQPQWAEHAEFADGLVEDGRILLGGPIEDPDGGVVALIAVQAPGVPGVHEMFATDPWVRSGVLEIKDVRPWSIWLRPRPEASGGPG